MCPQSRTVTNRPGEDTEEVVLVACRARRQLPSAGASVSLPGWPGRHVGPGQQVLGGPIVQAGAGAGGLPNGTTALKLTDQSPRLVV